MENRPWEGWHDASVAEASESYWAGSTHERLHREALADLCALFLGGPDRHLLEVGCGTGRVYERLVPRVLANECYTGVDVSEKMLAIARRNHPQGRFLKGDGYSLAFEDGAFDLAAAFEVLGHLPEIMPFVRELVRVSRRCTLFTVWPCAEGVAESTREVGGSVLLNREYSHSYLCGEIERALPGQAVDVDVAILYADCWAYAVHRRQGPPGVTLRRLLPVAKYRLHLLWELAAAQR
jgi:SAM-dependent methyltransferase